MSENNKSFESNTNEDGNVFWVDVNAILVSTKKNKHGADSIRTLFFQTSIEPLSIWLHLSNIDKSTMNKEESVVGAALFGDKLILQIKKGGDVYQLSKKVDW